MADMDPDTQERHDTLLHIEKQLENGHANDLPTLNRGHLVVSKCVRVIQGKQALLEEQCAECKSQKQKVHPLNWPTASVIVGILFVLLKILTNGGTIP
jgi:hypothetical protein